ncbi:MAG TPA: hypothetical protein VI365_35525 [Trebonia sp.]
MTTEQDRPVLDDPSGRAEAADAVDRLVAVLQEGHDRADANIFDRQFASDVLWGSPYGATLRGYDVLNPIHHSLKASGAAPPSQYHVVQLMSPMPGVVIAHVRRDDLTAEVDKRFSEMALYVLIKRDGQWWLAAGQNTRITERPA